MRPSAVFFLSLFVNSIAMAGLSDDCAISEKTSCVLNKDTTGVEFIVNLPNYQICGVRFLSDTYPTESVLTDFAAGLYVTAGPSWDATYVQEGHFDESLVYPVGTDPWFVTLFSVYTRTGETLNEYVHAKLATRYQPSPTVTLHAVPCGQDG